MNNILSGKLIKFRESLGHIHYFTKDLALQMLKDLDFEVLDYFYTSASLDLPSTGFIRESKRKLLKLPRKFLFALNQDLATSILGGRALLVLVK